MSIFIKILKIKYLCLSAFILITACKTKHPNITGIYHSEKASIVQRILLKINHVRQTTGIVLDLKKDSSYFMKTCGTYEKGKWLIHNDSLVLKCRERKPRSKTADKKHTYLYKCPKKEAIFKIKNRQLIRKHQFDTIKLISILTAHKS